MTINSVSPDFVLLPEEKPSFLAEAKALLQLGGPVTFTLLMEMIPSTTNMILVGQLDGNTKEYVDAASLSGMYLNITAMSVGLGMATAMDTLCNQAYGANNTQKFGIYLQGALLGMALTFVPVFFLNWFCEPIMLGLGQHPHLSALTGDFTRISLIGIPFLYTYEILKKTLQAYNIVGPTAAMVVVANAIHVGLGYYFVTSTSLGFYGAALARALSTVLLPAMMVVYFWLRPVHREWQFTRSLKVAAAQVPEFFRYGVPGMLMMIIEWGAFEVLTLLAGVMHDPVIKVGVMSILTQVLAISYLIYLGMSIAATIRIGSSLGAKNHVQAKEIAKVAYTICACGTIVTATALVLARHALPRVFMNDSEIIELTSSILLFAIPGHMLDGVNAVSHGVFHGMGLQAKATIINGIAFYIVGIPLAAVFGFVCDWTLKGLWVGIALGSLTCCVLYAIWLYRLDWAKLADDIAAHEKTPLVGGLLADGSTPNVVEEAKALVALAGPVMFTLFMEVLPSTTNMILVGQMNSTDTKEFVDAASISGLYINITAICAGLGLATAMDTLCTQAFGAGQVKKFGAYLQGALLGMALMLIPVYILNWFTESILLALGQDATIAALAGSFTRMTMPGLPFFFVYELLKKMLQAHNIVHPMAAMVVLGNVIHIVLGYFLVHHTAHGFYGAAIARSVSYVSLPLMMIPYFAWYPVHKQWALTWSWTDAKAQLPAFFRYGVPGMLMMVIEWGAFEILTLMAGVMPDAIVDIGVMSILSQILTITYLVYMGMAVAATIRVGNMAGANKPAHAVVIVKLTYAICAGCMVVVVGTLVATRHVLPALFISDPQVIELTAYILLFTLPGHILDGMNAVSQGIFRATGEQSMATVVNAAAFYLVGIPLAAVFGFYLDWGVEGLWVGFTHGSLTAFVLYMIVLCRVDWPAVTQAIALQHIE
ncbi:Multidrug/Oligosaccharidyl-lipid/Polysaccharide (MOP) Flippase Superfamily [Achlya hypogyna]|uniref:Multidrug/Oligosaccharidyl-lipid/Polysaccharide (MOP) Flippase Superfamily n=1 Tax=Achlya hypogyna TaxID=1202772 RepID=A0A1V9YH37_ACHHY|nr:Multidrug/Oligosaccharidyl-lipid/Polysaccharide (MOP) Flippase Superfamily [Achlya hypogyna]